MIKHIVMWKLKDGLEAEGKHAAIRIKRDLEALVPVIPAIGKLEVGINILPSDAAFDLALYSEFASLADLQTYMQHPDHQVVANFVRSVVSSRHVVDYET